MKKFRFGAGLGFGFHTSLVFALILSSFASSEALAQAMSNKTKAWQLHQRLTGTAPNPTDLNAITNLMASDPYAAAAYITDVSSAKGKFYSSTVRRFAAATTNEAEDPSIDLNDMSATMIGMVRDEVPYNQILSGDLVYVPGGAFTPYSHTNFDGYVEMQEASADLSNPSVLVASQQSSLPNAKVNSSQAAGLQTTRQWASAYYSAGTNRLAWYKVVQYFWCRKLEQVTDNQLPSDWVRQDVTRSPGGDSSVFINSCLGCHAASDSVNHAYAYFDYDTDNGEMIHTPGTVIEKLNKIVMFPGAKTVTDNTWLDRYQVGAHKDLFNHPGKGSEVAGTGIKALGSHVTEARVFSECMVQRAYETVCHHPPSVASEYQAASAIADDFESNNYNMKRLFQRVGVACMDKN